ncbi:hypothetical protein LS73_002270 [Helicobacter muridarum]|uniref:Uncharacterized protein n=2 Tax=Helicobacter muridarum TaxID=216 RepID=A0A4U8TKY7_9HELI|nr:hypothetical protein [Helicobacter muridarum]TLE01120.1 hypothetical protein LS73_002270 [Helicobacter muridarum]
MKENMNSKSPLFKSCGDNKLKLNIFSRSYISLVILWLTLKAFVWNLMFRIQNLESKYPNTNQRDRK